LHHKQYCSINNVVHTFKFVMEKAENINTFLLANTTCMNIFRPHQHGSISWTNKSMMCIYINYCKKLVHMYTCGLLPYTNGLLGNGTSLTSA